LHHDGTLILENITLSHSAARSRHSLKALKNFSFRTVTLEQLENKQENCVSAPQLESIVCERWHPMMKLDGKGDDAFMIYSTKALVQSVSSHFPTSSLT
jgi:hypothetical protein